MSIDIVHGLLAAVSMSWQHAEAMGDDVNVGFPLSDHGRAEAAVAALLRRCATEDDGRWLDTFLARRQSSHLAWEMAEVAPIEASALRVPMTAVHAGLARSPAGRRGLR